MKLLLAVVALLALCGAVQAAQGPYEEIQELLHSAAASSAGIAALDSRGPPKVIEVHHHHRHVVPHDMPQEVAEQLAVKHTPPPPKVEIVPVPNRQQAARHAAEDAVYNAQIRDQPSLSLSHRHTVSISVPDERVQAHDVTGARRLRRVIKHLFNLTQQAQAADPNAPYMVKGQSGGGVEDKPWEVKGTGWHFPLVDRGLQRPTFAIIADTDGADKAGKAGEPKFKPHTAAELKAEAARLLAKAKELQAKKNDAATKAKEAEELKKIQKRLGVVETSDANYEDELTRLNRLSARMKRLLEQIETPHNTDTFEGDIARKKYFLKVYGELKAQAVKIIEAFALRTGHSVFETGEIDESILPFLPPNSVSAILAQYANPTTSRKDETPRDVVSGKDAKRIRYVQQYYEAKRDGKPLPMPPGFAPTNEELRRRQLMNNPDYNQIIATQHGVFGQSRPAITMGDKAIGRGPVHVSIVNPTPTQKVRGLPFEVKLQNPEPSA